MSKEGLSKQERTVLDQLVAEELAVIQADDVLQILPISRNAANTMLSRLEGKGWLQRLKRGAYTVIPLGSGTQQPAIARAWPIAAELFAPCFISGWSAAEHWGLTDQIFNTVSLVTTRPQRKQDQKMGGIRFRVRTLPEESAFGVTNVWFGSNSVPVADRHRTIIDVLDAPDFGGGGRHVIDIVKTYWSGSDSDPQTLIDYAKRIGRGTIFKRLGFTAERFGKPSPEWLRECKCGMSKGISLLDPGSPDRGPIVSRWRLRVNIPLEGA